MPASKCLRYRPTNRLNLFLGSSGQNVAMTKAIALIHANTAHRVVRHAEQAHEALRVLLVSGCAMALVMAGRALPF